MEQSQAQSAADRLKKLKSDFQVDIAVDWGRGDQSSDGPWQAGTWASDELDHLYNAIGLLSSAMGGAEKLIQNLGGVLIQKSDIGMHGGEALAHRISLSAKGTFNSWTVVHEFAHAWDANHNWNLSITLEKYTGGYTSHILSRINKLLGAWDTGPNGEEDVPGRRGRKPGANFAGYFYGDKPSGSNWRFDRKEDFAEAVAMYVGWNSNNDLSAMAHGRVERYLLANGVKDKIYGVIENWSDYAKYFYPENGDYAKTKRWQYVDDLVKGKI